MNWRARLAIGALAVLVVYLFGSLLAEQDRSRARDRQVISVLADALEAAERAERAAIEAGEKPPGAVERILERVEGLDPELISQAVEEAQRRIDATPGPAGPRGEPGPPGPTTEGSTTTTAPPASTTSTQPATTTTTTRPPTTTTTRPCLLNVAGLLRLC